MKISRRRFLANAAAGMGGWLVSPSIAQQILVAFHEHGTILPVEVEPRWSGRELYASPQSGDYVITEGYPLMDVDQIWPTWSEYLEGRGVNSDDPAQVREWMTEYGYFDPDFDDEYEPPDLEALIDNNTFYDSYLEYDYVSPEQLAFNYLGRLPLACDAIHGPSEWGGLKFYCGPCPGSNYMGVHADNLAVISGLQQRLLQLGEGTTITVLD